MNSDYSVTETLRDLLAEARQAPAFELDLTTPWFDRYAGGLDRWRDEPADRSSAEWQAWKQRDDEKLARRGPARTLVRPGYRADRFASLGFWAAEAIARLHPRAHGVDADPEAVAAMTSALLGIGEVLVRHAVACGVALAEAAADAERTIRYGVASASAQVVAA